MYCNKERDMKDIDLSIVERSNFYKRYGYKMHWISGGSTVVYPITYWGSDLTPNIEIQLESHNNSGIMQSARKLAKDLEIAYGCKVEPWFCKYDGSCPNVMRFYIKN